MIDAYKYVMRGYVWMKQTYFNIYTYAHLHASSTLGKYIDMFVYLHVFWPAGESKGFIPGYFLEESVGNSLVPWSLMGMMLLNYSVTLGHSAVWHPDLSPIVRVENALTCFVLLDLAELLAKETAQRLHVAKRKVWIPHQTMTHLQELCGCIVIQSTTLDQEVLPWRSSELTLEQYFGYCRGQFQSSQFRTRDYLQASVQKAYQTLHRMKNEPPAFTPDLPTSFQPVTDKEFCLCADRAVSAAARLMSSCCECLGLVTLGSVK